MNFYELLILAKSGDDLANDSGNVPTITDQGIRY